MRLIVHRDCLELTDRFRALADEGKTMPRATAALLSTAAAAVLLAACGTDGGGGPNSASATSESAASQEPSSAASTIEAPTDPPATDIPADVATDGAPAFPESTARQTAEPSGKWGLVLTDVRVGDHVGFDRIVLEFAGNGTPGWVVNYVDEARLDGSGKAVTLGGEAVLDIYASGTTYPGPEGNYYSGHGQFEPWKGGDINDVHVGGTFEGYTQVLAGIEGDPVPFRVFALTDPSRLVVDVLDERAD